MLKLTPLRVLIRLPLAVRLASIFCLAYFSATVPSAAQEIFSWSGLTMGAIEYNIKVVAPDNANVDRAKTAVEQVLKTLNDQMSTYSKDSEVTRFNSSRSTDWFPVSKSTAFVVRRSLEISEMTHGAFDITVKPVVERWNFGAGKSEFVMPDSDETRAILEHVGYQKIESRLDPPSIKKSDPLVQIDLSAIAKGYAVDLTVEKLLEMGFSDLFVEIGGEVRAVGLKPNSETWRVGIERPLDDARAIQTICELKDCSMATSGDYRNFAILDGKRYSHTIDPKTGLPVTNRMASASVIASDCMTADAFATAVMVMGPKDIDRLAQSQGLKILTLERNGNDFEQRMTAGFPLLEQSGEGSFYSAFVGALVIFGLAVVAMAFGAIFANRPIKGSCGGISSTINSDGSTSCTLCQKPVSDCIENQKNEAIADK